MNDEIEIIPVDETHRIQLRKFFSADRDCWVWEIQKQELWRALFSFKKKWHNCSWEHNGSFFMTVKSYWSKASAREEAERIKNNFLKK